MHRDAGSHGVWKVIPQGDQRVQAGESCQDWSVPTVWEFLDEASFVECREDYADSAFRGSTGAGQLCRACWLTIDSVEQTEPDRG
ncbi:hypothetical protein [Kibdelosporangium phytohabitans]|uniref:Uncharacterized protein n=1 Tax=Kibdelosporangium phytohabitans TaxID=860235 RepID=A0A0N9HLM6_9PSEU|nr:hypothetical protein [Kibdelosporangium phytohabitans]ALG07217.1 hypothetical protein AOZ06_10045 [Kibdelosporangium phytohabitans]MBE1471934.1 hypothetical protein [Kibdelosporangium phytohabitans]